MDNEPANGEEPSEVRSREDVLIRELAEAIYTDFDKPLMDMEFLVSDLAELCAKDPAAHAKFDELVSLQRQRPVTPEEEESEATDG